MSSNVRLEATFVRASFISSIGKGLSDSKDERLLSIDGNISLKKNFCQQQQNTKLL
jgi:hypothetical protein